MKLCSQDSLSDKIQINHLGSKRVEKDAKKTREKN
jgi:hypothetical protein